MVCHMFDLIGVSGTCLYRPRLHIQINLAWFCTNLAIYTCIFACAKSKYFLGWNTLVDLSYV
jgi:hypothetical protein